MAQQRAPVHTGMVGDEEDGQEVMNARSARSGKPRGHPTCCPGAARAKPHTHTHTHTHTHVHTLFLRATLPRKKNGRGFGLR